MTTLKDCFAGLKAVCESVTGVTAYTTGDQAIATPAAVISLDKVDVAVDMGDTIDVEWSVAVIVDRSHPDKFDGLLALCEPSSPSSLIAAFEDDDTLGGRVADCEVTSVGQFGSIAYLGGEFYGAVITGKILGTTTDG